MGGVPGASMGMPGGSMAPGGLMGGGGSGPMGMVGTAPCTQLLYAQLWVRLNCSTEICCLLSMS